MNSKIAINVNSDSNIKSTDSNSKHRRPLQVIHNQQPTMNSNPIRKQKHFSEKQTSENQSSLASRLESLKYMKYDFSNDISDSDDVFEDENFRDIMKQFEHIEKAAPSLGIPKPTVEQMDEIYIRNTTEAKQGSNRKSPIDPFENDPEFGRVQ